MHYKKVIKCLGKSINKPDNTLVKFRKVYYPDGTSKIIKDDGGKKYYLPNTNQEVK